MVFEVVKTNIVNVTADAIVLPANEKLKEGSGTSRAIFENAGRKELTNACKKIGHCTVGSAVPTLAFNLNAKYIIHTVVPKWINGESNEYDLLSSAYLSALNISDIMGCESIAFPLLSAGNNGFDAELAIKIAVESIHSFSGVNLKKVILVVFGNEKEELMKSLGYTVHVIPDKIFIDERKAEHKVKQQKLISEAKDIAQNFMEDQIQKALDWLNDEKNREKILQAGCKIVGLILSSKGIKIHKK